MSGGKVTRHWVDLDYNSPDVLSADVLPYDATMSIKDAISTSVESATTFREIETYELTATDISNQYITLPYDSLDEEIDLEIMSGVAQIYNYDFKLIPSGSQRRRISWSPLDVYIGMVNDLRSGDIVKVTYTKRG